MNPIITKVNEGTMNEMNVVVTTMNRTREIAKLTVSKRTYLVRKISEKSIRFSYASFPTVGDEERNEGRRRSRQKRRGGGRGENTIRCIKSSSADFEAL